MKWSVSFKNDLQSFLSLPRGNGAIPLDAVMIAFFGRFVASIESNNVTLQYRLNEIGLFEILGGNVRYWAVACGTMVLRLTVDLSSFGPRCRQPVGAVAQVDGGPESPKELGNWNRRSINA